MTELLVHSFITFFVVIDPIGLALIFIGLTRGLSEAERTREAIKATALACSILLAFMFLGASLMAAIGVSLSALRIAGGLLLFLLAVDMVFARQSGLRSTTRSEQAEAERKEDLSVFPLAFPLITGPGAITTILLLISKTGPAEFLTLLLVVILVMLITLVSLLFASRIVRVLGETGANVISRVLGLVLAALAVQYVIDGIFGAMA